MEILLVNPYSISLDPNEMKYRKPFPPLGSLYLASYLRESGFKPGFFDCTFKAGPFSPYGTDTPDWVGLYTTSIARKNALEMIGSARSKGIRVMVGGPDASMDPAPYLEKGADIAVVGEGEETVREILEGWDPDGREIEGTAFLRDGRVHMTKPRRLIQDIDSIPRPARDLAPIEDYMGMWYRYHGRSMVNIISSRGCPYGCRWCCKPVFGHVWRQRSVDDVISEVISIRDTYAPDRLWFSDDILPMRREWVIEFSEAMRGIGQEFECLARVDLIDDEISKALRKGGCRKIYLGVESGSQRVLDAMGKGTNVNQIDQASRSVHSAGIEQHWYLMYGYPGEEKEDILATMKLIQELQPEAYGVSIAYPLPGTEFYEEVKDGISRTEWVQTLDNKLVFKRGNSQMYYDAAILWTHGIARTGRIARRTPFYRQWDRLTLLSAKVVLSVLGGRG